MIQADGLTKVYQMGDSEVRALDGASFTIKKGEIGGQAGQFHDEIGGYAKSQGVDQLFALGELAELAARNFGAGGRHFRQVDDLVAVLRKELDPNTVVLVKGSRFMRMERVADAIAVTDEKKAS